MSILARIALVACLAVPAAPVLAEPPGERESPPERLSREQLMERAAQGVDRAPLGLVLEGSSALAGPLLQWSGLGPRPIAYEYWASGHASGRVSAIVVDPRDPNVVYIAAAQGGVWKSTTGGASWTALTDHLSSLSSGALALDPVNPDIVWYATGEQHQSGDSWPGDGLFRSPDGGATWAKIATRSQVGVYVARIAVHPEHPDTMYAASSRGFVRSLDGGATWTVTLSGGWCFDIAQDPTDANVLFTARAGSGVFRSLDAGGTWTQLGGGLPASGFDRINLAIAPSNPRVLYASFTNDFGYLFGMYLTEDGGDTWTRLGNTPEFLGGQGWYDMCVAVDPDTADVCYAGGIFPYDGSLSGVIRTSNRGASWTDITFGVDGRSVHPDQHILTFGPDGTLWLGNDGGVWKTTSLGFLWTNCNDGLDITQFYSADVHPTDRDRIIGGTQDNGTLMFEGAPGWPQVMSGDGGPCFFLWNDPNTYFSTYVFLNPVIEWNNGAYVADRTGPWAGVDRASFTLAPLIGDRNTADVMLAGTYRVWRSTDRGASWDTLSGELAPGGEVMRGITVANGDPDRIWASSSGGQLWVTSDAATWDSRRAGLPLKSINDICVHPLDPLTAYIPVDLASAGRVWRTTNEGVSWTNVTGDLPVGLRAQCLAVDWNASPPRLYLGTDYGVWSSADGGAHWVKEGVPSLVVYDLVVANGGADVVAATHGRGMWRGTAPPVAVEDRGPASARLALAVPNPARAPLAIEFALPGAGEATLEVFDVGGRRVRTLARGGHAAGVHRASWDGRDERGDPLAGGICFVRLRAAGAEKIVKLALLR